MAHLLRNLVTPRRATYLASAAAGWFRDGQFPASRRDLLDAVQVDHAPDWVIDLTLSLPISDDTYRTRRVLATRLHDLIARGGAGARRAAV